MNNFHIIIPARYASTRLSGKMLLDVSGKPLIQRVWEKAITCGAETVTIATDDERIQKAAAEFDAKVILTSKSHENGTERLSEAAQILKLKEEDIVLNLQGDEPLVPEVAIHQVVSAMIQNPEAEMSTLCTPILNEEEIQDPNIVKVVFDKKNFALYFSRASIPYERDKRGGEHPPYPPSKGGISSFYRHLGLYAYRVSVLNTYPQWEPAPYEKLEKLEQLRFLWEGKKIHVSVIEERLPPGVDTQEDLEKISKYF